MKLIIHCSDSTFGNAALIDHWHRQNGWAKIGYHYVILNGKLSSKLFNTRFDGHIETGRPLDDDAEVSQSEIGAHVAGHNSNSVAICLIGKSGEFTPKQIAKLEREVSSLRNQFGELDVVQHSDLDDKKKYCAGLTDAQVLYLKQLGRGTAKSFTL